MESKNKKKFLRVDDLTAELSVGKSTIYKWLADGKLPQPKKIGRVPYWDAKVINALLSQSQAQEVSQ